MSSNASRGLIAALAAMVATSSFAGAQETPPTGWFNTAELTAVWTAGNSPASTFGLKNELRRAWTAATFKLEAGGLRTESGKQVRTAAGTPAKHTIAESTSSEVTAENYFLRGRYDRALSARTFLFSGAGWSRNTFAGIDSRYAFVAGAGNAWVDREGARFKTDYGLTWTMQDDVVDDPDRRDDFLGLRISTEALKSLTATTVYASTLLLDENLQETDDLRADFTNSIRVAISTNLALKTSLQLLYDNLPALVQVPLTGTGVPAGASVLTPLDKLDTVFTVALVIDF